jgi:hypothetical protein
MLAGAAVQVKAGEQVEQVVLAGAVLVNRLIMVMRER